ncbi:prolyl hydroxylase family protein [Sphingomonas alba]|uniref:2OG-Fe(II) oxygenase n=1 Tax=Sphingomonas alba TaxID=2908208 RepID=A0ABT0RPY2_9SPHN|nr:2OG-Fe(II) oxygenase [Sphingomonas alba]MCL6684706.1 2OG-Fe(II) oxygenase [Sphingomonas alba]
MSSEELPPFYKPLTPFSWQTSAYRAEAGRKGRESLAARGARQLHSEKAEIYLVEDFFEAGLCERLVALTDGGCIPSELFVGHAYEEYRTSQTCNLPPDDPAVVEADTLIDALLQAEPSHGEPLQGQRYAPGQHYRMHPDFFYVDQAYWPQVDRQGGQRTWTAMAYLNEPEAGGATRFPYLDLTVTPKRGMLLAWNNMITDGSPNNWTMHQGCDVEAGTKYIVTKWYREKPFVLSLSASS